VEFAIEESSPLFTNSDFESDFSECQQGTVDPRNGGERCRDEDVQGRLLSEQAVL
jgi:hypothetical protein